MTIVPTATADTSPAFIKVTPPLAPAAVFAAAPVAAAFPPAETPAIAILPSAATSVAGAASAAWPSSNVPNTAEVTITPRFLSVARNSFKPLSSRRETVDWSIPNDSATSDCVLASRKCRINGSRSSSESSASASSTDGAVSAQVGSSSALLPPFIRATSFSRR